MTEKVIQILVNTIENIVRKDPVNVKIRIEHDEIFLGESDLIKIEPDLQEPPTIHSINFEAHFSIDINDFKKIGAIVSTPLLVQVIEEENSLSSRPSAIGDLRKKEKPKSGKKSIISMSEKKIVGISNIDMIPIILGEKKFVERLVVEEPKQTSIGSSWMNLPILTITMSQNEVEFFPSDLSFNFLNITVESIHNPPSFFNESSEFKAATIVHVDEEPEVVIFDNGHYSKYQDVELTKRWRTLNKLEGRGKLSKYKINSDHSDTKNQLQNFELKKVLKNENPRIEWNTVSRHVLFSSGLKTTREKMVEFRHWPFQFSAKTRDSKPQLYQCCVDVSELLYPGRTKTRVATRLLPLNTVEMLEKTGFDEILLNDSPNEVKNKEKKPKSGARDSIANSTIQTELSSNSSLTNESGEPTFVVIEFAFRESLVPSRTSQESIRDIMKFVPSREKLFPYPYTGDLADEQYVDCIRKLAETIVESYRDFHEEDEKTESVDPKFGEIPAKKYSYIPDETDRFTQYLYENGIYVSIKTALKKKIVKLLDKKFTTRSLNWDSEECQNFVSDAYLYLVEQMHVALNSESENNCRGEEKATNTEEIRFQAEESYELGNVERTKQLYLNLIAANRDDPEPWLSYATFLKREEDFEECAECCREAIRLNSRHKLALVFKIISNYELLMYGILLAESQDYETAEIFIRATTHLYPRSVEAWGILHLLFLRTQYYPGMDLTLRVAEECLLDPNRDPIELSSPKNEPLAWSTIRCDQKRIYLILAVFLLKLNCYDFASLALSQELTLEGRSSSWLYYMAVHHYLMGRYGDALTHLQEARRTYGLDYSISGLMGHCHFKEDDEKSAMECWEFASTFFDRPTNIHLIDIRMGNYLLEAKEYQRAKRIFLDTCHVSPTSISWFGLGIACYEMNNCEDAECAFIEANGLDRDNPDIWAYLCLLNMTLNRYDQFTECYRQLLENDLQNEKLWLRITSTMESLGLSAPISRSAESKVFEDSLRESTSDLQKY